MEQDVEAVGWIEKAERLTLEFFDAVQRLYVDAGEPPLRTLAARSTRLSASNLSALLNGKRAALPTYEVMTALVEALMHGASAPERGQELQRWHQRWTEVRYAKRRAQTEIAERDRRAEDRLAQAEQILADARTEAERLVRQAQSRASFLYSSEVLEKIRGAVETAVELERAQVAKTDAGRASGELASQGVKKDVQKLRRFVDRYAMEPQKAAEIDAYLDELEGLGPQLVATFYEALSHVMEQIKGYPLKPETRR